MRQWQKWPRATVSDLGSISGLAIHEAVVTSDKSLCCSGLSFFICRKGAGPSVLTKGREWEDLDISLVGICKS